MSQQGQKQTIKKEQIESILTQKLNNLINVSNCEENQNVFVLLNRTLNSLNSDNQQRYNTQNNQIPKQILTNKQKKSITSIKLNRQYYYQSSNKFVPQPWEDQGDVQHLFKSSKNTQTNHQNTSYYFSNFSLSQKINEQSLKNIRSSSAIENYKEKPIQYGPKTAHKTNGLSSTFVEGYKNRADCFNYTNQQKARVSLDYLVHQKKQKKLSKMLKMKTHCLDKTAFNHQKISYQSKFLIEALEKLSTDNILKKSIDRAVDVLKKRTSNINKGSKKVNNTEAAMVNQISCHKIQTVYDSPAKLFKENYSSYSMKNIQPQLLMNKTSKITSQKQTACKVSFKPKRNWIIQTRKSQKDSSKIKISELIEIQKIKPKNSNNFLKINQLHM